MVSLCDGYEALFGSNENILETDSSDGCVMCAGGGYPECYCSLQHRMEKLCSVHLRTIETYHTSCQMSGLWMYGRRNAGRPVQTSSDGGAWA